MGTTMIVAQGNIATCRCCHPKSAINCFWCKMRSPRGHLRMDRFPAAWLWKFLPSPQTPRSYNNNPHPNPQLSGVEFGLLLRGANRPTCQGQGRTRELFCISESLHHQSKRFSLGVLAAEASVVF